MHAPAILASVYFKVGIIKIIGTLYQQIEIAECLSTYSIYNKFISKNKKNPVTSWRMRFIAYH